LKYRPPPVCIWSTVRPWSAQRCYICCVSWLAGAPPRRELPVWETGMSSRALYRLATIARDESLRGRWAPSSRSSPPPCCSWKREGEADSSREQEDGVASLSDDSILLQVATEWQEDVRMSGTWPTTTILRQRRSRHGFADMIVDSTARPSSAQTRQADRPVENWRCGSSRRLRASPVCRSGQPACHLLAWGSAGTTCTLCPEVIGRASLEE